MSTKSFKIGECAVGGIIKVTITGKVIQIDALDYFTKEKVCGGKTLSNEADSFWKIKNYLNDLTTSYHADNILKYIESKVTLNLEPWPV